MNHRFALLVLISLCPTLLRAEDDRSTETLKVLLIASGCCHDYATWSFGCSRKALNSELTQK